MKPEIMRRVAKGMMHHAPTGPVAMLAAMLVFAATPARAQAPRDTVRAEEVVVTASRTEQRLLTVPTSVSVAGPAEIAARGQTKLDEVLRGVPGVTLAQEQVSVRGSSGFSYGVGSRVLLLVDGVPLLGPDAEGISFEALPLEMAERVEVVKGPGSALYGSGALGGVVQVVTQDAPDEARTLVTLQGGAYTPVRHAAWRGAWAGGDAPRGFGYVSLAHARPLGDDGGMWVAAHVRGDAGYLRLDRKRRALLYGKLTLRPGAWTVRVLGGATFSKSDNFLYWNGLADALNPGTLALGGGNTTGSSDNQVLRYSLLPSAVRALSPRTVLTLRSRLFGAVIRSLDPDGRPYPLSSGTVGVRYGGEAQLVHQAPRGVVTAGASVDANATRTSFFADDLYRGQPEGAVFGQWDVPLTPRLRLTPGLRFDAYRLAADRTERRLSPKLAAGYTLSDAWHLRAAYGAGFRVPGVTERYVDDSDFLPLVANPDLAPETSDGIEAGVRGRWNLGAVRMDLDAATFRTDYHDLVEPVFVTEGGDTGFKFVNLTRARVQGVEAGLSAEVPMGARALTLGLSATLLDAKDLTADRPLVYRNPVVVQARADVPLGARLSLGADYRYARRPSRVDTDFARFVPDADAFADAHVLDLRAAWESRFGALGLLVRNALDHYYVERPAILAPTRSVALQWRAAW
jgi:outer membrane receptor for ferrienterochelin and colicins